MNTATFYSAGCPVCVAAEQMLTRVIDQGRYEIEIVDFRGQPQRIVEAEALGVKTVPTLVLNEQAFHINIGTPIADLKD